VAGVDARAALQQKLRRRHHRLRVVVVVVVAAGGVVQGRPIKPVDRVHLHVCA
jgi:hypothetical protein